MENESFRLLEDQRCEYLRWRGLFIDGGQGISTAGEAPICWCLKTQIGLGPDGEHVGRDECTPARPCYSGL